jgi:hypothetical protein
MKKLIAIATLGLTLSFPCLSFTSDYMVLYTKLVVKSEVKNEIASGKVEKDFMSFYNSPKSGNTPALLIADQKTDDDYVFYRFVFGFRNYKG